MKKSYDTATFTSSELQSLLKSIGKIEEISENTQLFQEGASAHHIYLVKSGLIQVGKSSQDGKELTMRLCQEDAIFGELNLFNPDATYLLSAKALETSFVYIVDKIELEDNLMNDTASAIEFMKWFTNHMRVYQYKMRDLTMYGKTGALYSTLIRLSNSFGIPHPDGIKINISLTDTELASFAAATRESANRMLIDLRKRGVISRLDSGKLIIKDIEYLKEHIGCDKCPLSICNID